MPLIVRSVLGTEPVITGNPLGVILYLYDTTVCVLAPGGIHERVAVVAVDDTKLIAPGASASVVNVKGVEGGEGPPALLMMNLIEYSFPATRPPTTTLVFAPIAAKLRLIAADLDSAPPVGVITWIYDVGIAPVLVYVGVVIPNVALFVVTVLNVTVDVAGTGVIAATLPDHDEGVGVVEPEGVNRDCS